MIYYERVEIFFTMHFILLILDTKFQNWRTFTNIAIYEITRIWQYGKFPYSLDASLIRNTNFAYCSSRTKDLSAPLDRPRFTRHFCRSRIPNRSGILANGNSLSLTWFTITIHRYTNHYPYSNFNVPLFCSWKHAGYFGKFIRMIYIEIGRYSM